MVALSGLGLTNSSYCILGLFFADKLKIQRIQNGLGSINSGEQVNGNARFKKIRMRSFHTRSYI